MYLTGDLQSFWPAGRPICTDCGGGGTPQGQFTPEHVRRVGALPGTLAFTGRNIGVAVMDTGVDRYHRDLTRADGTTVVGGFCYQADLNVPCDVDIWPGLGHGTGVAGVIAAQNNSVDIVGVAPDVRIFNVNVFRADLSNDDGLVMAGLDWIAANKFSIQVVNMSFGRDIEFPENDALHQAVQRVVALGIPITVSAGNFPDLEVRNRIPAAYPEVMAIASTTATWGFIQPTGPCASRVQVAPDTASAFTTDGRFDPITGTGVTISAPGNLKENIVEQFGGCVRTTTGVDLLAKGGGIYSNSGTSFSSPLVAGVVSLMKEQAGPPGAALTPDGARTRIRSGADRIGVAPLDSGWFEYTFDGEREGILWAPGALQ